MKTFIGHFKDSATVDAVTKTAVSVRDGVLEYAGAELGLNPPDRVFSVYRSPATIANAAMRMLNVPVTDGHIDMSAAIADKQGGMVMSAEMFDAADSSTSTTIAVRNKLSINDELLATVTSGTSQLSLGYTAEIIEVIGKAYDFEQRNISPHHLAVVPAGRCGSMCSFVDHAPPTPQKPPRKESTTMNTLMALLQRFADSQADGKTKMTEEEIKADALAALPELIPEKLEDAAKPEQTRFEDTKSFADAVAAAAAEQAKQYIKTVDMARQHLPAEYKFADKSAAQIMRDAIATQNSNQFTDSELPVAFKMLAKPVAKSLYPSFGEDVNQGAWDKVKNSKLGG
jgi:hypothetical protein